MGDPVLTPSALLAWSIANRTAVNTKSRLIETVHLFLAILQILDEAYFVEAEEIGMSQEQKQKLQSEIARCKLRMGKTEQELTSLRREIRLRLPFQESPTRINGLLHRSDETRKIFKECVDFAQSRSQGKVSIEELLDHLLPMYEEGVFTNQIAAYWERPPLEAPAFRQVQKWVSSKPKLNVLDEIGRDLTKLAREGKLNPVVGRDREMVAIARILNRTSKRNVILIGEAGVGKTAVVEGLAQKCMNKKALREIKDLRILQANVSDLISGTSYRGEMEQRLKQLITEATSDPNIVLFIDEIHLVMKSGTTGSSAMDIANILKPALARDDFRCIGATTVEEYDRFIKDDAAFMRRFQTLRISEPSPEMATQICVEWAKKIENKLKVQIIPEAIHEAIDLSIRHLPSRRLPDKAIDLLENAAAAVKISSLEVDDSRMMESDVPQVGIDQIRSVLTDHYQVSLNTQQIFSSKDIESHLREEIVGQDQAIEAFIRWVDLVSLEGLNSKRTLGFVLFYGPPGVGKTFFAECVARAMNELKGLPITRFNMSEYKESYELSRLTGAAPGLIGHDRQGPLFQFVDTHPQGVILLDGLEKAHPDVIGFFSNILETGEMRDSRGRMVNFKNHLFIITCDLEAKEENLNNANHEFEDGLLSSLFSPDLLTKIDLFVPFRKFSIDDYQVLFNRKLSQLKLRLLESNKIELSIDDGTNLNIVISIMEQSVNIRSFLRLVDQDIFAPILKYSQATSHQEQIVVTWQNDRVCCF